MVVNFRVPGIIQGMRKLSRTLALIKKKDKVSISFELAK